MKYNRSEIMRNAWTAVRTLGISMSEALKKAWAAAKAVVEKIVFNGVAKVAIRENGEINPNVGGKNDCDSNYLTFKLWEKGGKRRIYMNDYKRRSCGYIDLDNNTIVDAAGYCCAYETAEYFLNTYTVA